MTTPKEELEKIKDSLMYDFPKHYDNHQIMAYQQGLTNFVATLLSAGWIKKEMVALDEKEVGDLIQDYFYKSNDIILDEDGNYCGKVELTGLTKHICSAKEKIIKRRI